MSNEPRPATTDEPAIPASGKASSYSNYFVGKRTASGEIYSHDKYTAAILPRARWNRVRMGTKVKISCEGKTIVVLINDKGAGSGRMDRVLDLSRRAMSALVGWTLSSDADASKAGIIDLEAIDVVPASTPLGPVADY
ncbi:MAG: hypothetical protein IT372_16080 [Polyangiaceae bacterium]|nr:hypothetical protein [Polyangiaceae bacterium]